MCYLSLLWPALSLRYINDGWLQRPDSAVRRCSTTAVRKMALSARTALGAQRGGTIDWSLTTIISSSFVTMEHELPLEVISEDLRLVNKGT